MKSVALFIYESTLTPDVTQEQLEEDLKRLVRAEIFNRTEADEILCEYREILEYNDPDRCGYCGDTSGDQYHRCG